MNEELLKVSAEIAELRRKIEETSSRHNTTAKDVLAFSREVETSIEKIKQEAQRQILSLRDEERRHRDELTSIHTQLNAANLEIEEKNKLYAKLLEEQNNAQAIEQLKRTLDEICVDFEAYFKLHIYQHEDVASTVKAYLDGRNGMLNANDMGLGKTCETAVSLYVLIELFKQQHNRKPRVLWLTKKSLVPSSPKEIKKWWPGVRLFDSKLVKNEKDRSWLVEMYTLAAGDILLTNYEFVRTTKLCQEITWDLVVIDEVHKLKGGANVSGPTAIWTAIKDVCRKASFTFMLSGTPMVNRPEEMWSYLHIFAPERFPNIKQFERQFMDLKTIAGETRMVINPEKLLTGALKGQMIRRRRDEVGLQLPENTREFVQLQKTPGQEAVYKQMRENFFVWLDSAQEKPLTATAIIAQLTRLRQINVWPAGIELKDPESEQVTILDVKESSKIDECMDLIEAHQDQVVVFCTFNGPLFEVKRRAELAGLTCEVVNGESVSSMGEFENRFQQNKLDILCINSAMGEGLNLQKNPEYWPGGACLGIFLDWWWSPARNEQCEARYHRQGANVPVMTKILENEESVDAFIFDKVHSKSAIFSDITESEILRPATEWRTYLEGVL